MSFFIRASDLVLSDRYYDPLPWSQAIFSFDYIYVKYEVWTVGGLLSNIIGLEFDHNCD